MKVKVDFYKNINDYKIFLLKNNFESNWILKEKFKDAVEDDMTQVEVLELMEKYNLNLNEYNEAEMKYALTYQNALFNKEGEILLEGRIKRLPESINSEKAKKVECSIHTDWDGSWSCSDRRFKGQTFTEQYGYSGSTATNLGCGLSFDLETRATWFKKVSGIWVHKDADDLTTYSGHPASFDFCGGSANSGNIYITQSSVNEGEAIAFDHIWVYNNFCTNGSSCPNATNSNVTTGSVNCSYNGHESGSCGSTSRKYLTISNCN